MWNSCSCECAQFSRVTLLWVWRSTRRVTLACVSARLWVKVRWTRTKVNAGLLWLPCYVLVLDCDRQPLSLGVTLIQTCHFCWKPVTLCNLSLQSLKARPAQSGLLQAALKNLILAIGLLHSRLSHNCQNWWLNHWWLKIWQSQENSWVSSLK